MSRTRQHGKCSQLVPAATLILLALGLIAVGFVHDQLSTPVQALAGNRTSELKVNMPSQGVKAKQAEVSLTEEVLRIGHEGDTSLLSVNGYSTDKKNGSLSLRINSLGNLVIDYPSGELVEPVRFPMGKFRTQIDISDGLSLRILVNDSVAYARAGVLQGLGVDAIESIEVPVVRTWSGVISANLEIASTNLGRSADALTSLQWGLAIAIGLLTGVMIALPSRRRSQPVGRIDLQTFILCASLTAGVLTVVAVSAPIFDGTSPFIEPEHLSMNDWVDSVLASSGEAYQFAGSAYPPGAYFVLSFLQSIPRTWYLLFAALSIGVLGGLVGSATRLSNRWHGYIPGVILVLSLPTLFALDRGNLDLVVAAIVAVALVQFVRGNRIVAASLAGFATGLKIYPGYQALVAWRVLGRRSLILIVVFSLSLMSLTIAAFTRGILKTSDPLSTVTGFLTLYSNPTQLLSDYSVSAVPEMKWFIQIIESEFGVPENFQSFLGTSINLLALVALVLSVLYVSARRLDVWRSQFLVALIVPLLSSVAFYYRLTLVIATFAIITSASEKIKNSALVGVATGVLLGLPIGTRVFGVNVGSLLFVPICVLIIVTLLRRPVSSSD